MLLEPNLSHKNNKTIKTTSIIVYNTTDIYFINKESGLLQGGLSGGEHTSGLVVLAGIK